MHRGALSTFTAALTGFFGLQGDNDTWEGIVHGHKLAERRGWW
jgi:hypothetical protein